ncbi:MAG: hypothetical protein ACLR8U_02355 [Oscillospiraceae bacterium]
MEHHCDCACCREHRLTPQETKGAELFCGTWFFDLPAASAASVAAEGELMVYACRREACASAWNPANRRACMRASSPSGRREGSYLERSSRTRALRAFACGLISKSSPNSRPRVFWARM